MSLRKIILLVIVMMTALLSVHAQDASDAAESFHETEQSDSDKKETSAPNTNDKTNSLSNSSNDSAVDEKNSSSDADGVNTTSKVVISSAESVAGVNHLDAIPRKKTPKMTSQPSPTLPEAPAPCIINDTIGCPIDPCLTADSVLCQPQPEPPVQPEEESSPQNEGAPLFSFNPLWVVGPVMPSNPSAGTLVTTSIPIELTETGPNPYIIGQADGRSQAVEVFSPATAPITSPLTGLFSSANLPWLGLLVLLVLGIFAWRGRKQ